MKTCKFVKKKVKAIKKFIDELEKTQGCVDEVKEIKNDIELIKWFDTTQLSDFIFNATELITDEKTAKQAFEYLDGIQHGMGCSYRKRKGVYVITSEGEDPEVYDPKEFIDYMKQCFISDELEDVENDDLPSFSVLKKLVNKMEKTQQLFPSCEDDWKDWEISEIDDAINTHDIACKVYDLIEKYSSSKAKLDSIEWDESHNVYIIESDAGEYERELYTKKEFIGYVSCQLDYVYENGHHGIDPFESWTSSDGKKHGLHYELCKLFSI